MRANYENHKLARLLKLKIFHKDEKIVLAQNQRTLGILLIFLFGKVHFFRYKNELFSPFFININFKKLNLKLLNVKSIILLSI